MESKLQHGTACCDAYIEAATTGLSPAMVTPSQIVVTAATAVAHTASMKRQQSRAPPAVGIACCAVHAGTTACVVKLCAASLAACALCVRMCSCRVFSRNAPQPRVPRCAISHPARYPMACATCVRWRRKIGRVVVTDSRVRVWLGRQWERCTQEHSQQRICR